MKAIKYFFVIFISLCFNDCSEADAKESKTKSNAFDKIDKRDKKLFTQQERIESYNKSNNKSQSLKKSLSSNTNSGYSGYGSSTSKYKNFDVFYKSLEEVLNDEKLYRKHLTQSVYATANIASIKFQNVNKGLKHLLQSIAFMIIFFISLYAL